MSRSRRKFPVRAPFQTIDLSLGTRKDSLVLSACHIPENCFLRDVISGVSRENCSVSVPGEDLPGSCKHGTLFDLKISFLG